MSKYKSFFAAFNTSVKHGNPLSKEEQVLMYTKQRTSSLKDLSEQELKDLTNLLNQQNPPPINDKADRMRKSIIAIFRKMDRTAEHAKAWSEKQGVKGEKKGFNEYTPQELFVLINIAEKVLGDWRKSVRKQVLNKF